MGSHIASDCMGSRGVSHKRTSNHMDTAAAAAIRHSKASSRTGVSTAAAEDLAVAARTEEEAVTTAVAIRRFKASSRTGVSTAVAEDLAVAAQTEEEDARSMTMDTNSTYTSPSLLDYAGAQDSGPYMMSGGLGPASGGGNRAFQISGGNQAFQGRSEDRRIHGNGGGFGGGRRNHGNGGGGRNNFARAQQGFAERMMGGAGGARSVHGGSRGAKPGIRSQRVYWK
ncbi:hypothetical protein LTR74_009723 [Friedmanniomyces endolithicus]|nr:hypothetical protein LTR74_009723 [Friedmanniomyces endolithicus]